MPDEGDVPPDGPADRRDDEGGGGGQGGRGGGVQAETRHRQEYYADLRVAVSAEESVSAQRVAAGEQATAEKWGETVKESRWMWAEYQRRWPPGERAPADKSDDPPGSWHGDGNRVLYPADNGRVEAACDRIADREREKISPAMRATESQDPDRHLVGFDDRLKGSDRIKEKVYELSTNFTSRRQAVSLVPDGIRYTFQYQEARYTQGVLADIERLKGQGFELDKLKNSWSDDQYKGINSQWIEPAYRPAFRSAVPFPHQLRGQADHPRCLRTIRTQKADKFEQMVLEAFQKKVTAEVPVPPGAEEHSRLSGERRRCQIRSRTTLSWTT